MISEVKFYLVLALSIILLTLLVVTKAQLWEAQNLLEAQRDKVQTAKINTAAENAEKDAKANESERGYIGAVTVLSGRVRELETVPRCPNVFVAAGSQPSGSMPEGSTNSEVTYIDLADHYKVIRGNLR